MKKERTAECRKCGFVWTPRVEKPRACPRCKSYLHNEPRKQK
jgi:predicted Zn-ribbon and HTH transcriptional regulator